MKKVNSVIYYKLLLQAEEAKDRNLTKLANGIVKAIGSMPEEEKVNYSYSELQDDLYDGLWKLAANIIKYYDLNSVDAEKLDKTLESLANKVINEVEKTLDIDLVIGPYEVKVPGQD